MTGSRIPEPTGAQLALHLRGGLPLQEIAVTDEESVQRSDDRIGRYHRLMRKEYDSERQLLRVGDRVAPDRQIVREPRLVARRTKQ